MGGGAGIRLELDMDTGWATVRGGKLHRINWPISAFDAHGYMDGWSNIDGKYLKVTGVDVNFDREDVEYAKKELGWKSDQEVSLCVDRFYDKPHFYIFGGYVRGDYRNCFPAEVKAEVNIDFFGLKSVSLWVEPARGFQGMYKDVFDDWCYHGPRWTGRKWEKKR